MKIQEYRFVLLGNLIPAEQWGAPNQYAQEGFRLYTTVASLVGLWVVLFREVEKKEPMTPVDLREALMNIAPVAPLPIPTPDPATPVDWRSMLLNSVPDQSEKEIRCLEREKLAAEGAEVRTHPLATFEHLRPGDMIRHKREGDAYIVERVKQVKVDSTQPPHCLAEVTRTITASNPTEWLKVEFQPKCAP